MSHLILSLSYGIYDMININCFFIWLLRISPRLYNFRARLYPYIRVGTLAERSEGK